MPCNRARIISYDLITLSTQVESSEDRIQHKHEHFGNSVKNFIKCQELTIHFSNRS